MGHFTVRRYAAAFDDASYQLLWAMSDEPPIAKDARIGWADVRQVYEYHAEMQPGDLYEITGKPVRLGTSSVDVEYAMRRRDTGDLVATMASSLVRFDLAARKSAPIEGAIRERIDAMRNESAAPGA